MDSHQKRSTVCLGDKSCLLMNANMTEAKTSLVFVFNSI